MGRIQVMVKLKRQEGATAVATCRTQGFSQHFCLSNLFFKLSVKMGKNYVFCSAIFGRSIGQVFR